MRLMCAGFCWWLVLGCAESAGDDSPLADIVGEWRADAVAEGLEDRLVVRDDGSAEGTLHRQTSLLAKIDYTVDIVAEDGEFELAFACDTFGCEMYEFTTGCELDDAVLLCVSAPEWYHRDAFEFMRVATD